MSVYHVRMRSLQVFFFCRLLSLPFTLHCIVLLFLSCCEFFSQNSLEIWAFFLQLFSFHVFIVSSLFFKVFVLYRILENLLNVIFSRDIVHENLFLSMCWVDVDIFVLFGLLYLLL
jgi:hypothetical protein